MKAEALNLRVLMVCSIQENFKKVTESAIVKCVQKKYSSYIIDKTVSLRINCSKALVILPWFLLLFLLFLLIVYISLVFHLEGFQSE